MAKSECENSRALSIAFLKKHEYLGGWKHGGIKWTSGFGHESNVSFTVDVMNSPHIRFTYTCTDWGGEKVDLDYRVELVATRCHFGGKRYWFICPLSVSGVACGRRVGVIYLPGKYFGCRKCHDLAYQSQQESSSGLGILGIFLSLSVKIARAEEKIRVKYWRGRPTKRYARILRNYRLLNSASAGALLFMEKRKDNCGKGRKKAQ